MHGLTGALAFALAVTFSHGALATELARLFSRTAAVELDSTASGSLVRLPLPPEVLAACRADLSDVRMLDARGTEIPFVIDHGSPAIRRGARLESAAAKVLAARRHESPRPMATPILVESYELSAPPRAPSEGVWELVFDVRAPHFVRGLTLESLLPDGKRVTLAADETLFRFEDRSAEKLRVALPELPGPRLLVTLTGEELTPLEPRFHYEAFERAPPEAVASVPLAPSTIASQAGHTVIELAHPPGIVPTVLRVATRTPAFSRAIEVRDVGAGGHSTVIGRTSLFRIRGAEILEQLEVPLEPARGKRLAVDIEDGDSPPLEELQFNAVVRTPSLVFAVDPASVGQGGLALYFGGGRVHAPRYDLATLVTTVGSEAGGVRAKAAQSFFDPARITAAHLGTVRENPEFDRTPALGFARHPGATLDVRLYSHRRPLDLVPSPDGLAEVVLTAHDLSLLRPDAADVRFVDAAGRQWPFLLESAEQEERVRLSVGEAVREGRASRRGLSLPFGPLGANALVLDVSDSYFDRPFVLRAESADSAGFRVLLSGRLARAADGPELPIVLEFPSTRLQKLELTVEDGDNAPLRFSSVSARVPVPSLYVVAPPGHYALLLGNPAAVPASYDIEAARALVLSVASERNVPSALEPNPSYRAVSRLGASGAPERIALWIALSLAVLFLGGWTLRLVKKEAEVKGEGSP